ncbi:sodium channel protein Nach [Eupeodes corollae]|uniref:sodium channel protein Nach n=1 Tax=Eupeodes corollae TaxID=290404 RepID=UPI0024902B65|nr:sodium channel protein Nach [Eupeodes corollae]
MSAEKIDNSRWNSKFLNLFLLKGAIHGLPYVGKATLTLVERVVWLILPLIALYCSIHLALESLDRFNTKSTVISIERDYHYWNTTIPSATICPMERISLEKFNAFYSDTNMTDVEKSELFDFLESLANASYFNFNNIKEYPSIEKLNIDPMDYMELIYNLTENYIELPIDNIKTVSDSFFIYSQQILTEWGICYSTNNYLIEKLSTTNLLFGEEPPKNVYEDTENFHKTLSMNVFDGEATFNFMGFKGSIEIYVHGAYEVMNFERRLGPTQIPFEVTVQVYDITASDDFGKSTTVEQRKCRFPHETNLTHFPIYTRNLCYQECRINLAYKLCKCIPHFYPNRGALKPVCHFKVLKDCLFRHGRIFENLNEIKNLSLDIHSIKCNCLQNCRSSEVLEKIWKPLTQSDDLITKNGIIVIMKTYPNIRYRRQIIFTLTDLLVSIGGTAGFFLGSSVLSVVEIIYYFTFRWIWHCLGFEE